MSGIFYNTSDIFFLLSFNELGDIFNIKIFKIIYKKNL